MLRKKLLKLNKMDGSWNYKKPCRTLSAPESAAVFKFCIKWWEKGYENNNSKTFAPFKEMEEYYKYYTPEEELEEIDQLRMMQEQSLIFMNKKEFENTMKMMYKNIGKYFLPYLWITVSPQKQEAPFTKEASRKIAKNLDEILRTYFYKGFRRCDKIHWAIEFGADGDHAHVHILCRPLEAQQKSMAKNFSRDFYNLWKKKGLSHLDKLNNKKFCFNIKTLRREEFINDKLKYLNNDTKDAVHDNPFDEEIFKMLDFNKYENC